MSKRDLLALLVLSLVVRLGTAALIRRPGYMDAAYYSAGAVRLAEGGGLNEPFIWNYLDDPPGLPHPGFLYWMPLPSLVAALGAWVAPGSFFALQVPSALLSALLPPLAYVLAWRLLGQRRLAWLAGMLMLCSGFFFPYWTLPESFAPYALFGGLALAVAGWSDSASLRQTGATASPGCRALACAPLRAALAGILAGLAHLTRADGMLILLVAMLGALLETLSERGAGASSAAARPRRAQRLAARWGLMAAGYLLVMMPWFVRNLVVAGAPLPAAGSKTLWLRTYEDLYCSGCDLTPAAYLAWGWESIARSKLWAAGVNLQRFLAEDCMVFLFPLVAVGLVRCWRHRMVRLAAAYMGAAFLLHTLAFTFPGPRGGFFHASAAALPALYAVAASGLDAALGWLSRLRRWNCPQAHWVFTVAAIAGAAALSAYAASGKLRAWRGAGREYEQVAQLLAQRGAGAATVMVGDPPAFWYYARQPAIAVPNNSPDETVRLAEQYRAAYLLLDANYPLPLAGLYTGGEVHPQLEELRSGIEGLRIFRVTTVGE